MKVLNKSLARINDARGEFTSMDSQMYDGIKPVLDAINSIYYALCEQEPPAEPSEQKALLITQEMAAEIWRAHHDLIGCEKLLAEMEKAQGFYTPVPDTFGRTKNLSLGWPTSESCKMIMDVPPSAAREIVTAHAATLRRKLAEIDEQIQQAVISRLKADVRQIESIVTAEGELP